MRKKLRYTLLVVLGVLFISFLTACHKQASGTYYAETSDSYIELKVDNGKGSASVVSNSTLKAAFSGAETQNVSMDKDKITIGSNSNTFKIEDKNIVLGNGVTFYPENSDGAKNVQKDMNNNY